MWALSRQQKNSIDTAWVRVSKLNFLNEQMAEQHQTIPVKIYNAEHHIMADEPLQTIACIETIINNWEFDSIKYNAKL